jgi:pyruvate/2-oxoglutarate dehydrogenase complex dihydrolipoamide acyltransferase (E2) component
MPTQILMPALSPTMEEGTLARWLVKVGAAVKSGDIMAEIETDKATMEFEAVDEGVIGAILVAEGTEGVKVNAPSPRSWPRARRRAPPRPRPCARRASASASPPPRPRGRRDRAARADQGPADAAPASA